MSRAINTGGTAFPMQDPQAIHAYAAARIAHIPSDQGDERDSAYIAARSEAVGGMTLRQYAAIQLRVPDSGTDWLDAMIRKAAHDKLAAKAMQGSLAEGSEIYKLDEFARWCCAIADAMLKARESSGT